MNRGRLAVLVGTKGRGSNMEAIVRACKDGRLPMEVVCVIAPSSNAPALYRARFLGAPVRVIESKGDRFANDLLAVLEAERVDLLCLAGFMRLLPEQVVRALPSRILNIHPALLPKFGGKGMYGMRVHEAVIASGDRESGATVHFVNERYDEGSILLQKRVPVEEGDTPETLAARVLLVEHETYVEAIRLWWERYGDGRNAST
ncbi:MAG: phosphoribosylglycinamide formyltransferase [Armatimonadota bacterium]